MRKSKPKNSSKVKPQNRATHKPKNKTVRWPAALNANEREAPASGEQTSQTVNDQTPQAIVSNSQLKDSGCKVIFEDNTLCAQFLRDYIDLPCMKDVQPGDIEDVSAQFVPLIAQERNADRVKRVHIRGGNPFFLISLIEHKTKVDYNVCRYSGICS